MFLVNLTYFVLSLRGLIGSVNDNRNPDTMEATRLHIYISNI